jgi:hypothetical protein
VVEEEEEEAIAEAGVGQRLKERYGGPAAPPAGKELEGLRAVIEEEEEELPRPTPRHRSPVREEEEVGPAVADDAHLHEGKEKPPRKYLGPEQSLAAREKR